MAQTLVLSSEDQDMGEDELCGAVGVQIEQVGICKDQEDSFMVAAHVLGLENHLIQGAKAHLTWLDCEIG